MAGEAAELSATVQMMKFMSEQINKLVEMQKAQAEQQCQLLKTQTEHQAQLFSNYSGQGGQKNWDNMEKFKNLKQFAGEAKDWEEFATKFRSQAGANDIKVLGILDVIENELKEGDLEELKDASDYTLLAGADKYPEDFLHQVSQKLYNVLLSITTGEANSVVRRCRGNGMWAWKKLCTTLNPRTLATGIKMISQAVSPAKITQGTRADVAIDSWEHHLSKLSAEYGEVISAKMKVAVLYTMLPKDLQERVLDKCAVNWDGAKEKEATRE